MPPVVQPGSETRELPVQTRAAVVQPASFDEANRTVELVWTTGARVRRYSWARDEYYEEELSTDPAHVDLSRLESGAPLLNTHGTYDLDDIIGVVRRVWVAGGEGRAVVEFSGREAVAPIAADVQAGIIRNVSVGYQVNKFEITREDGKLPVYRAVSWMPTEISLVPVGADAGAGTRAEAQKHHPCVFVDRALAQPQGATMPPEVTEETGTRTDPAPVNTNTPTPAPAPEADANAVRAAIAEERTRVAGLRSAGRALSIDETVVDRMIEEGIGIDAGRARMIDLHAERAQAEGIRPRPGGRVETGGQDETDTRRTLMVEAMLHRYDPGAYRLSDGARQFRGMTLVDMARECVTEAGGSVRGMSRWELATAALNLDRAAGMHTTSDFPTLLANVANKTLRDAYDATQRSFTMFCRRTTLPDFKAVTRAQLGENPALEAVNEHGEFKYGTMGEGAESYALATYGKIVGITRKVIVNDDLGAFTRVTSAWGVAAASLESDVVWAIITGNPTMGDGTALFHADHGNLTSSGTAISVASLGVARALMRRQKGLDAATFINVAPKYLIVPPEKETLAWQYTSSAFVPGTSGDQNPYAGTLETIAEPRLTGNAWYLAAAPAQVDTIEYAYLEGEEGVQTESRVGFTVDGVEYKARLDFAAKAIDYRGLYKNAGA